MVGGDLNVEAQFEVQQLLMLLHLLGQVLLVLINGVLYLIDVVLRLLQFSFAVLTFVLDFLLQCAFLRGKREKGDQQLVTWTGCVEMKGSEPSFPEPPGLLSASE